MGIVIHRTVNLDSQIGRRRKPTNFSKRIFAHSPSRSFSVLLVLITRFLICRSNHSAPPILYPMAPRFSPGLPPYDPANPQSNSESLVSCLARTANTVSLATDIDHDLPYGLSSLAPTPHRRLAPQTFIARVSMFVWLLFRTRPVALAVAVTGNMATLGSEA